ncbi:hypothetical protein M0812_18489 [Anaeramoeba flamelloides]|uniref:Uncharacterized protein n=1 Tax=Anaeramoeba flamelloides TaxID=1746091 RepID=A0AAV7Z5H2_9EUKA|nr:hypothetical protein M0812_18489 [Anaeramoeba flamelloides]
MQKSSKPFSQNLNRIYIDTTNWVLRERIQTKKILSKKHQKNVKCIWHGSYCSTTNSGGYSPLSHGGEIYSRKNNKNQTKNKRNPQPHCRELTWFTNY